MRRSQFALALAAMASAGHATALARATTSATDPRSLELVDQRGRRFTLGTLRGAPTLVTFVATRCTDACPIADGIFAGIATHARNANERGLQLLTITFDPAYDTPFVMARRAQMLGAQAPRWRYASGKRDAIAALARSLGVVGRPDARGIPEAHSSFVYLLDRHVRLARSFLLSADLANEVDVALAPSLGTHKSSSAN